MCCGAGCVPKSWLVIPSSDSRCLPGFLNGKALSHGRAGGTGRPPRRECITPSSTDLSSTVPLSTMLSHGLAPLTLLISQQISPDIYDNAGSCLSYHGTSTTGRYSFFSSPDEDCIQNSAALLGQGSLGVTEPDPSTQLVWLEHNPDAFDPSLLPATAVGDVLASLQTLDFNYGGEAQDVLGRVEESQFVVLHADSNSALVQMDRVSAASVDMHIPPLWRSMFLPFESFARIPVPTPAVERVQNILDHVKFNPDVAAVVNNISLAQMKNDIRFLTGEDDKSGIVSRHSFSEGSRVAAKWLKERFEQTGAECTLEPFLRGFAPNVIWCVLLEFI